MQTRAATTAFQGQCGLVVGLGEKGLVVEGKYGRVHLLTDNG